MSKLLEIWDPRGARRIIGRIDSLTFSKTINEDKHIFRKYNALTIDEESFRRHILNKCQEIIYVSPQRIFTTTPDRFTQYGIPLPAGKFYRAHIALPLMHWKITERSSKNIQTSMFQPVATQ